MLGIRLKRKIALFATCAISLLSVATLAVSTYAWFRVQNHVNLNIDNIVAEASGFIESIHYHEIKGVDEGESSTTFTFSEEDTHNYALAPYSPANPSLMHQLLIEIVLLSNLGDISITAVSDDDILDGGHSWSSIQWAASGNPLSSIASMSVFMSSEVSKTSGDIVIERTPSQVKTFTSIDAVTGAPTYTDAMYLRQNIPSSSTHFSVYVLLDYSIEAIDSIYSAFIGDMDFAAIATNGMSFSSDFRIEVVRA